MTSIKVYKTTYTTPIGQLSLVATDKALIGAWFLGQTYYEAKLEDADVKQSTNPILAKAVSWLDAYFAGNSLPSKPALSPIGTPFQQKVWQVLATIPQGSVMTYGEIADCLGCQSAQAVGGAVGRNPLSIFIPCHRVISSTGELTGYAGGLDKKIWLLEHEGVSLKNSLS